MAQLEEWDPLLVLVAMSVCARTESGWVTSSDLVAVCSGLGERAAEAVELGWPRAAAARGLLYTRSRSGSLELRPVADVLSHIFKA